MIVFSNWTLSYIRTVLPHLRVISYHFLCKLTNLVEQSSDSHVVTKSERWVSYGYSGFLPHEDYTNTNIGANEHDLYKLYVRVHVL